MPIDIQFKQIIIHYNIKKYTSIYKRIIFLYFIPSNILCFVGMMLFIVYWRIIPWERLFRHISFLIWCPTCARHERRLSLGRNVDIWHKFCTRYFNFFCLLKVSRYLPINKILKLKMQWNAQHRYFCIKI